MMFLLRWWRHDWHYCDECHVPIHPGLEHTQHDPECTSDGVADEEICSEFRCTWEDVCEDCCNVCTPAVS